MDRAARFAAGALALAILLVVLLTIPEWRVSSTANLRECQGDALKAFAHLRKANEQGVFWPPHQFENDYILSCMSARGFVLRDEPRLGPSAQTGEYALHMRNPDSWGWNFA